MLGYFARVIAESWMLYFPCFFSILWRGVFASTPSAAQTEARERVRFNRAPTTQSAWAIREPHCAPLEAMCRRFRADHSRDARARNVGADSPCRVRMGCATEQLNGFVRGRIMALTGVGYTVYDARFIFASVI